MTRVAIYARFSSDLQNEKSCRDQIDLCSTYAEAHGFAIVGTFQDDAVSGASTINRPAMINLLRSAQDRKFDTVLCETLDRLSRDQADLLQIRKELAFHDITIHSVQDGLADTLHIGIKGLMGELYLVDLAQKTKRGLRAVIKDGRQAGGRSYGYSLVIGKAGEQTINEREAKVVLRIFTEYAAHRTPRQIAAGLNQDAIPGPRGGKWNASTINGSRSRQSGILQNRLYAGQIVWNRQRFVKNPATGKRISRINPESEWLISDVPELRIVNDVLFQKVSTLKAKKGTQHAVKSRKPRYLLSGLIKCGCCGASYTVIAHGRIGCAGHRERGDCDNNRTITRQHVEQRVLIALQSQLGSPDTIAAYVSAYNDERKRLLQETRKNRKSKQLKLQKLNTDIEHLVDLLLESAAPAVVMARIHSMEAEQQALIDELDRFKQKDEPINVHPDTVAQYQTIVVDLQAHLDNLNDSDNDPDERDNTFALIRELIDRVFITPTGERKPVAIHVEGQLAALLSASTYKEKIGHRGKMVAGAGFEPTTFGL